MCNRMLMMIFLCVAFGCTGPLIAATDGWYTEGDFAPSIRIKVTLVNRLEFDREQCRVVIKREMLPIRNFRQPDILVVDPLLPGYAGPSESSKAEQMKVGIYFLRKETNGHYLPFQLDDIDQDGLWDELFFITDMKANESRIIYLYLSYDARSQVGLFPHETHAEIGNYGREYVPWWESKAMGWKLWFFDSVDMYGKCKPKLIANYENTLNISGHTHRRDYGNDILWVSNTFGAGAVCLIEDPADIEAVSRPRFSPTSGKGPLYDTRFAYHVIANGPLRSIIRTDLMDWRSGKGEYELSNYYTAYAGKSYSTCRVQYTKFAHEDNNIEFGVGMRKIMNEYRTYHRGGVVISNGKDLDIWDINAHLEEGKKQIFDWEGIALVVRDEYKPRYYAIEAYGGNHLFRMPVNKEPGYEFMMFGGWSDGYVNSSEAEFQKYVLKTAREYNSPIGITGLKVENK